MKSNDKAMPDMDSFRRLLKDKGLKATPQRISVHDAMMHLGHASADMVVEYLHSHNVSGITVSSVYNILSTLADIKIYHRRTSSNNKMYFDVNTFKHMHLYDFVRNEYKDVIDDELVEMVENRLKGRKFRGYKVESVDIQLVCRPSSTKKTQA